MTTEREELAWAAGFVDGEGSFWVREEGARFVPCFAASQVDRQVLDRLVAALGFGIVYGPYGPYGDGSRKARPIFQFRVRHREVKDIAEMLWPWLSPVKREQAERVLASIPTAAQLVPNGERKPRKPWTPIKALEEQGLIHWDGHEWIDVKDGSPAFPWP